MPRYRLFTLCTAFTFGFFSGQTVFAQSQQPISFLEQSIGDFCNKDQPELCLNGLFTLRCGEILFPMRAFQYERCSYQGQRASGLMKPKYFEYITEPKDGSPPVTTGDRIIFAQQLKDLVKRRDVQSYLGGVLAGFEAAVKGDPSLDQPGIGLPSDEKTESRSVKRFNLWDFTYEFTKRDFEKSLAYLGILFQDTRRTALHLKFLDKEFPEPKPGESIENRDEISNIRTAIFDISKILNFLDPVILESESAKGPLPFDIFPAAVHDGGRIPLKVYHFYPIAYLAHLLTKNAKSDEIPAQMFIPILFRAEAEFRSRLPNREFFYLSEVKFDIKNPAHRKSMEETYSAVVASFFGLNANIAYSVKMREFIKSYAKDPKERLLTLYSELPRKLLNH